MRFQNCFSKDDELHLLTEQIKEPYTELIKQQKKIDGTFNPMMYSDWKYYLPDDILTKVDMASMKVALEARTPFLDYTFVEFTTTIPEDYKATMTLKGLDRKYLLKKAMLQSNTLPREILYGEKQGFTIPLKNWLRSDLKHLFDEHLNEKRINEIGIFNYQHVNKLIQQHLTYKKDNHRQLWAYIVFDMWYKENMEK